MDDEELRNESLLELGEVYIELLQTFRPNTINKKNKYEEDLDIAGLEQIYINMYNTLVNPDGTSLRDTITYKKYIDMVIKSVEEELKIRRHN